MIDCNYWGTPLSKIKELYPDVELSIRQLLANACAFAERNLKRCNYILFSKEKMKIDNDVRKKIIDRIKGLKQFETNDLNNLIYALRGIHNFSFHFYFKENVLLYKESDSYRKLLKYNDYPIGVDYDDNYSEITFFGAVVVISHFLDISQSKCLAEDFKEIFKKFKNPIYLRCKDKESAYKAIKKITFECCHNTEAFEKMSDNSKRSGFDTNSIVRRNIGLFFDKIEECSEDVMHFPNKLKSINIDDTKTINDLLLLRNWYCHGGYILEEYDNTMINLSLIIEILSNVSKLDIDERIKDSIKTFMSDLLRDSFDMDCKYSIKLFDRRVIGNGIRAKKIDWISHRIKNMDYHRFGIYSDDDFRKMLSIVDNTYESRYNDTDEFNGLKRNFITHHIQFVTLKSKNNISIFNEESEYKEITFINPLYFNFKCDEEIKFTKVNGINLKDILNTDSNDSFSRIEIDLDKYKFQKTFPKKYMFYDIECANCHDNIGKISSFGYVLTDESFNVLESDEIVINPEADFYHNEKDENGEIVNVHYDPDNIEKYLSANVFEMEYERIKKLFSKTNTYYIGFSNVSDAYFLIESIGRYKLNNFNYRFIDLKNIIDKYYKREKMIGLEKAARKFGFKWNQRHNSLDDAMATMEVLKRAMLYIGEDDLEEVALESDANYLVKDGKVFKNDEEVLKKIYPDMLIHDN